jgi:serine/threonine-protein kinase
MLAMTSAELDAAAQRSLVGAVLSRSYRLTQKLGEGGMGEVYAAEALDGGRRFAVKILHPEFLGDPTVLERFLAEAQTGQRLQHPNIVRIFDVRTAEDGSPYIAMELMEGVPLSAYTQNGGRVALAQAAPILRGMLAGLAAAHAQGVVHRDLKPENVFLARDGQGRFVVKLLDFGIAKVMDVAGGMGSKTRTGMLLGTPAYMSPEQIKNAKDVDARADLWSAGVMFYEMLTGRVAFPAPTEYARLTAVLTMEPEPIEQVDPGLAPIAPFLARALKKDRALRFQSAAEMAQALTLSTTVGSRAPSPADEAHALSRLPEVPQLYVPSVRTISTSVPTAPAAPVAAAPPTVTLPNKTPGGTLTSPSAPAVLEPSPQVLVMPPSAMSPPEPAQPTGNTMPSNDLPMLAPVARGVPRIRGLGVPPLVVVLLVAGALVAGFLLGYAVARM